MTVRDAIKCGLIGTACLIVGLVIKYSEPEVVQEETTYTTNEASMPRSRNPFCMEVADIEALVMQPTRQSAETTYTQSENLIPSNQTYTPSQAGMLTASGGVFYGPSGTEKWYDLPMDGVVEIMRHRGFDEAHYPYWVREDGCKMFGDYIMLAANLEVRPRGTILETSRGTGIVCDCCVAADADVTLIDLATVWGE